MGYTTTKEVYTDMPWIKKDTTYNDIREKSLMQWLDEMNNHEDIAVRGGVRLAKDYIQHLKEENALLQREIELRNEYLKKMKKTQKQSEVRW